MNAGKNDIKVGDTFVRRGKIYKCVEDDMTAETFDCANTCALNGDVLCKFCACFPYERKDGKSVHFEEDESCK